MNKSISILGCGWLGLPLAEYLISNGFNVKGSTTSQEKLSLLSSKKIIPFYIELNPNIKGNNIPEFFQSQILIIDIPPGGSENKISYHTKQITSILDQIQKSAIEKIIFISSTSVYGNVNREVIEEDDLLPEKDSGKALKKVEKIIFGNKSFDKTIIRFAGLFDDDRNPVRYFAGNINIPSGNMPVNLIHRKDCIKIIYEVIVQNAWNEIFNACSDFHPAKREFYTAAAEKLNLKKPEFIDTVGNYKIVNSEKLKKYLGYNFIYPNPLSMI
ncbi:MAG TPA: hypothetical protein VLB50_07720 [Ignavibacteriaceae bacterium]|nr:hypothetical protein [Ignavibacteriaceae bacterium]